MSFQLNALDAAATISVPGILVTVAQTAGSVPRLPGAKMVITEDRSYDTIGGGHLEMRAMEIAREMLAMPTGQLRAERRLERFPLGPSLGQCCGGVVHLAFERLDSQAGEHFATLAKRLKDGQDSWRLLSLDTPDMPGIYGALGSRLHGAGPETLTGSASGAAPATAAGTGCKIVVDAQGGQWLVDSCLPHRPRLYLFGAGHVGAAIVRALAELPCHVVWIDEREEMFPDLLPSNVSIEATDTPEAVVAEAPPGASFLVLTHSHALDQLLSEHILRRTDFTWFGLIGSRTKRVSFERRLQERGIPADRMSDMTCPIGVPGIQGKEPAVIAIAVVAQLLQVWEAAASAATITASTSNHMPAKQIQCTA